ncbi:hypothetical protein B0H14DRAFT_2350999 [Mycena olivaceomarginata]|nr:hypothetical protein B0H14DRAFT_2350999 [Mycena olivaceomarginata]
MIEGDTYPTNFLPFTRDAANVVAIVGQEYPGEPGDLPVFCEDDCKVLLVSSPPPTAKDESLSGPGGLGKWLEKCLRPHILAAFEELGPPSFDIGCFLEVFSNCAQFELIRAFDRVKALGPAYGPAEAQRSVSPALHLGVWERYTSKPIIMGDSRQINAPVDKREKLVDAVHDLCGVVKAYWLPKIRAIVEWYYPGQEKKLRMHACILKHLGCNLAKYPNFDFGGMITTLAVKEGGSEKMHVDWFDNMNMFAWVTAVGDFEGGDFCSPQLGGRMPCKPGSLLGARTRFLTHCCIPVAGRRIVFTFFVDSCLFERTMHKL